jgi:hypothetical protein
MSNNTRIVTTDGKSLNGAKQFGFTIKDKQSTTTPNMSQLTISSETDTVQTHRFVLKKKFGPITVATNPDVFINLDVPLLSARFYQFNGYITIVIKNNNFHYTGCYTTDGAIKEDDLINFRSRIVCSSPGMASFLNDPPTLIKLQVLSSYPRIVITFFGNIDSSVDVMVDITINSAAYTV